MSKRKDPDHNQHLNSSSSDSDTDPTADAIENIDVDFEFFDPSPATDFHGLKTLLRQLFDADAPQLDLSAVATRILDQPLLGTTVKVGGGEGDPFAFVTVLGLGGNAGGAGAGVESAGGEGNGNGEKTGAGLGVERTLLEYLFGRTGSEAALEPVRRVLRAAMGEGTSTDARTGAGAGGSKTHVGLILAERLINMPPAVIPPMYTMLLEEMQWAVEEAEPYTFTHYLIWSKTYREVESALDMEYEQPSKKQRKKSKKASKRQRSNGESDELFYFHPEDEVFAQFGVSGNFEYEKEADQGSADSKRVFADYGIKPNGHLILIEAEKLEEAIKAVSAFLGAEDIQMGGT